MNLKILPGAVLLVFFATSYGQTDPLTPEDSLDNERLSKMISLTEVVIRSDLNVPKFIDLVKKDTTFYKAFRSLHLIGYSAWNDIRIDRKSTRLNSSHSQISYAVFCLKKKKKKK